MPRISIKQIARKASVSPNIVTLVARAKGIRFSQDSMLDEEVAIQLCDAIAKRHSPSTPAAYAAITSKDSNVQY